MDTSIDSGGSGVGSVFGNLWVQLINFIPNLLAAIAILVLGWMFATVVAVGIKRLLKQTDVDNRLGAWLLGQDAQSLPPTERWIAATFYWVILIFVLVAVLNALQLEAVSRPLNDFLEQIFRYLPRVGGAALLLGVAWLVATVARMALIHGLKRFNLDDQLARQTQDPTPVTGTVTSPDQVSSPMATTVETGTQRTTVDPTPSPIPAASAHQSGDALLAGPFLLNETLGNALYWFILLFFLPLILDTLNLQGPLEPVQNLLDQFLSVLPRVLGAAIIGALGWLLARIIRGLVTNLMVAAGINRIGSRVGIPQLAPIIGMVVYVLVLIPTAIAALNTLEVRAISDPAVSMLEQVLTAIPQVIGAGLILAVFYFIGRFLSDLVTQVLRAMGFDDILTWLGLPPLEIRPTAATWRSGDPIPDDATDAMRMEAMRHEVTKRRTPSQIVGIVVLVGILLFGAVPASELLQFAALTEIVQAILLISARVLSGILVFAVGLYLANLAFSLVSSLGGQQSQILAQVARIAILVLVGAMALQQMGVATDIVVLAFGLVLGAIAVAVALAFGLGGRDVAAEQLRQWLGSFHQKGPH